MLRGRLARFPGVFLSTRPVDLRRPREPPGRLAAALPLVSASAKQGENSCKRRQRGPPCRIRRKFENVQKPSQTSPRGQPRVEKESKAALAVKLPSLVAISRRQWRRHCWCLSQPYDGEEGWNGAEVSEVSRNRSRLNRTTLRASLPPLVTEYRVKWPVKALAVPNCLRQWERGTEDGGLTGLLSVSHLCHCSLVKCAGIGDFGTGSA